MTSGSTWAAIVRLASQIFGQVAAIPLQTDLDQLDDLVKDAELFVSRVRQHRDAIAQTDNGNNKTST